MSHSVRIAVALTAHVDCEAELVHSDDVLRRSVRVTTTIEPLLVQAQRGDRTAADQLFAAMYDELRHLAEHHLHQVGSGLSLGTTTLLHEAYLNIAGRDGVSFPDRSQFMGYASRAGVASLGFLDGKRDRFLLAPLLQASWLALLSGAADESARFARERTRNRGHRLGCAGTIRPSG